MDNLILGELNKRANRYRHFRALRIKPEGLEELRTLDTNWIQTTCRREGYQPMEYLDYYRGVL